MLIVIRQYETCANFQQAHRSTLADNDMGDIWSNLLAVVERFWGEVNSSLFRNASSPKKIIIFFSFFLFLFSLIYIYEREKRKRKKEKKDYIYILNLILKTGSFQCLQ